MINKISFLILTAFLLNSTAWAVGPLNPIAPSDLPHTTRSMKTAGFWIGRHSSPDAVIMNAQEIITFNERVSKELKLRQNLLEASAEYDGEELAQSLKVTYEDILSKNYFFPDGSQDNLLFFQDIKMNMNLSSIPRVIEPQFGFVVSYADQRFLPTKSGLYAKAFDINFDELQNNALDIGTPVVILHKSFDDAWVYTVGPSSAGWIEKEKIATASREKFDNYLKNVSWAVALEPKVDIFVSEDLTAFHDHVQMGSRFPIARVRNTQTVAITIPTRRYDGIAVFKTMYVDANDVGQGNLAYTARNILKQAFLLLNAPYGWGGMYGEQDCSRFLQMIFATVGIELPRDSKDQSKVGRAIEKFEEKTTHKQQLKALSQAPILSILTLKGHIMLYLGMVNDRPMAIHAVWAYREPGENEDGVRVLNRVVVSDLYLGEGSQKGSLLKRLTGIREIKNAEKSVTDNKR